MALADVTAAIQERMTRLGLAEDPDRSRRLINLVLITLAVALLCTLLTERPRYTRYIEQWASDFRLALFSPPEQQHPDIVAVVIDENTLERLPYQLPVDHGFLADLFDTLNEKGGRAIGVDMLFERLTEPDKDAELKRALRESRAPLVTIWEGPGPGSRKSNWTISPISPKASALPTDPFSSNPSAGLCAVSALSGIKTRQSNCNFQRPWPRHLVSWHQTGTSSSPGTENRRREFALPKIPCTHDQESS